LGEYQIHDGECAHCGTAIAGCFENQPGDWGAHRLPVDPAALLHELAGAADKGDVLPWI
jgi:pyruvate formate lyase activating enzyme